MKIETTSAVRESLVRILAGTSMHYEALQQEIQKTKNITPDQLTIALNDIREYLRVTPADMENRFRELEILSANIFKEYIATEVDAVRQYYHELYRIINNDIEWARVGIAVQKNRQRS